MADKWTPTRSEREHASKMEGSPSHVQCGGCGRAVSLAARAKADGNCPKCGSEIELTKETP
jgi:rRNA maturation endonuclease Nob1